MPIILKNHLDALLICHHSSVECDKLLPEVDYVPFLMHVIQHVMTLTIHFHFLGSHSSFS